MEPPPPPPPPHGANRHGGRSGGLPDGKYDIFVVPPSSAGAGFLYLPSLQTQRNSFLAGVACTATVFFIWNVCFPIARSWMYNTMYGGGSGIIMLLMGVGVLSWAFGKTQAENSTGAPPGAGGPSQPGASGFTTGAQSPPRSSWQRPPPQANTRAGAGGAKTSWEKAREETRKKEEDKRRTEELKKKREELEKERQKQREKETRERLERELKEKRQKDGQGHEQKGKSSPKRPPMPSARTEDEDDAYSFRPYDRQRGPHKANSAASMQSESSYAASQTTARTTPPPSFTGPYSTKDPDKIVIKGVYSFTHAFMRTPVSQLLSGKPPVTDGLILRITTEGLFIDDDRRGVAQREWDVKAWTIKLAEVWCPSIPRDSNPSPRNPSSLFAAAARLRGAPTMCLLDIESSDTDRTVKQSCEIGGFHIMRASIRDQEGKKYVFVLSQGEGWKVAVGLQRLRRGTQVRAMGVAGLPMNEAKALLQNLGYL